MKFSNYLIRINNKFYLLLFLDKLNGIPKKFKKKQTMIQNNFLMDMFIILY